MVDGSDLDLVDIDDGLAPWEFLDAFVCLDPGDAHYSDLAVTSSRSAQRDRRGSEQRCRRGRRSGAVVAGGGREGGRAGWV